MSANDSGQAAASANDRGKHRTRMTRTMMTTTMQQSNRIRAMRGGGGTTAGEVTRGHATTSWSKRDANKTRHRTGGQEAITLRGERQRQRNEK